MTSMTSLYLRGVAPDEYLPTFPVRAFFVYADGVRHRDPAFIFGAALGLADPVESMAWRFRRTSVKAERFVLVDAADVQVYASDERDANGAWLPESRAA